jgi:hypothetical protein
VHIPSNITLSINHFDPVVLANTLPEPVPDFDPLSSLRQICLDPKIHTLTLPLIQTFYGPSSYPSLHSFPGCTAPNARQSIQAPGLLNCSALGAEIQHCQSLGKRVLLSVKASEVGAVSGNTAFGDPNAKAQPFGAAFGSSVKKEKRDDDAEGPVGQVLPVFNVTSSKPPYKPLIMGHGPVVINGSFGLPKSSSVVLVATPTPSFYDLPPRPPFGAPPIVMDPTTNTPVVVVEANPLPSSSSTPVSEPFFFFPNLFDSRHPPSAFALTLFSLFSEGHTERSDLRPLGPDVPSGASPPVLNGTNWINPILTALQRPLGEEVVVDGFDIQVPAEWKGTYQDRQFKELVRRLQQLLDEAWKDSGEVVGGPADLGADGKGVVYSGFVGGSLKTRSVGLKVTADVKKVGWFEWDPIA